MRVPLVSEFSADQVLRARDYAASLLQPPERVLAPISKVAVVGGATAGLGLALALARSGSTVTYLEDDAGSLERAQFYLSRMQHEADQPDRLALSLDMDVVADCEAVVDMTTEPMPDKHQRLRHLSARMGPVALLLSNLSGPHLETLAAQVEGPDRVLGAQLFFPMAPGSIAELAIHPATSETAISRAQTLVRQVGKQVVLCGLGLFVSERLQMRMLEAADTLLMDGATPWEIDEALEAFGYEMGLYEAQDLIGTDVAYAIRQRMSSRPGRRFLPIADRAVQEGRLGKKASVGWYRYPGGEGKVIDPLVEDLCREESHFAGVTRRTFTEDELREILLLSLINESAWAVGQGCATTDIDLVSVQALGFPANLGGVLYYARRLGFPTITEAIGDLAQQDAVTWAAAPLLTGAADQNVSPR
jgi:3-hydroxyacyl-CoA dehydrogenase